MEIKIKATLESAEGYYDRDNSAYEKVLELLKKLDFTEISSNIEYDNSLEIISVSFSNSGEIKNQKLQELQNQRNRLNREISSLKKANLS